MTIKGKCHGNTKVVKEVMQYALLFLSLLKHQHQKLQKMRRHGICAIL